MTRKNQVRIRMSDEEIVALKATAKSLNMTVSDFIRDRLANAKKQYVELEPVIIEGFCYKIKAELEAL